MRRIHQFMLTASLFGALALGSPKPAVSASESQETVIVQFNRPPDRRLHDLVRKHGGVLRRTLPLVNGASYQIPSRAIGVLSRHPSVVNISSDGEVRATMDVTAAATGAKTAWTSFGVTGRGIGVAVIDSGVTWHTDLLDASNKSRVVYEAFFRPETTGEDLSGHGTHVAGIIAGRGAASTGSGYSRTFKGIAPEAKIINLAALDRFSRGKDSDIIAAIDRAISLKSTYNIRVMNLSLGRPVSKSYKTDPLCQAVEKAWKAGIVVVVAAGNEGRNNSAGTQGYATIGAPANDPYVITVGAMRTKGTTSRGDDVIASYSSKGPTLLDKVAKPDLVAPGNQMVATLALGGRMRNEYPTNASLLSYYQPSVTTNQRSDYYYSMSGTSMAAPVVSGTVALMLQKDPSLTPDQVKARLMRTATKSFPASSTATDPVTKQTYVSYHDLFTVGAGYLDVNAALADTDKPTGSSLSPAVKIDTATGAATLDITSGSNLIWGSNLAWGTNMIWGTALVSGTNMVWGSNMIWGTAGTSGFNMVWGSNMIWGTGQAPGAESDPLTLNGDK